MRKTPAAQGARVGSGSSFPPPGPLDKGDEGRARPALPATFLAFCKLGHRIIPSIGCCYTVDEVVPPDPGADPLWRTFLYAYVEDCPGRPA